MSFDLIQIQTTGVCNARCQMCPYKDSWFIDNHGQMTDKLFNKILDQIPPDFSGKICPYLMNEPFADSKMIKRISKIKKMFPKATIEVSTNAELLNYSKIKSLTNLLTSKDKIVISSHGIDEKSYKEMMKLNYEKSIYNIINLVNVVNGKIPIAIQSMAYSKDRKFQYYNTRKVERYWKKLFRENELYWHNVWLSTLEFHNRAGNVKLDGWDYDKQIRKIGPSNQFYCKKFDKSLNVLWNGDVVLCCMDYMHDYVYGNLNKQTIEEVFKSEEYYDMIDICGGRIQSPDDMICKRCQTGG